MKRLQLKYTPNKSKLSLNCEQANGKRPRLTINNRHVKQNLSLVKNSSEKEEIKARKQELSRLPRISSNSRQKSITSIPNQSQLRLARKSIQILSVQKEKGASLQQKNLDCKENWSLNHNFNTQQFIRLLQQKNIIENILQKICISSHNFEIILTHFIPTLNNQQNKLTNLFRNFSPQISSEKLKQLKLETTGCQKRQSRLTIVSKIYQIDYLANQSAKNTLRQLVSMQQMLSKLQKVKNELDNRIVQSQQILAATERKKDQIEQEIKRLSKQVERLSKIINQNTQILQEVQQKKIQLQNFVKIQKNKIALQASEYHKNLETDMFEFQDYLRHHGLGKKQYQHSIYYSENERIIGEQASRYQLFRRKEQDEEKGSRETSPMAKIRHHYSLMIDELHKAIDEKTKFIKEFCRLVYLWYENYLAKNQFLNNLKKSFALQVINIEKCKKKFCHEHRAEMQKCQHCGIIRIQLKKLFGFIDILIELFGMGNSFY